MAKRPVAGSPVARTEPEVSRDGRWITIEGRRWRATDPSIPGALRQELVDELMDARRAVGAARRTDDDAAEATARRRVQLAKAALGERGEPWWEPTADGRRDRLGAAILALAAHRGPDKTICPSDAARAVGGDGWRALLPAAREEARRLAHAGAVAILQRGAPIDPDGPWRGPVRIGLASRSGSDRR